MTVQHNQTPVIGAAAKTAVVLTGIILSALGSLTSAASELVSVSLAAGCTGVEVQKALDSLADRGGQVVLPPGEILISAPIVLRRDGQTLRGAGAETVLKVAPNANCPAIIMGEPVDHPTQKLRDLHVLSLAIDGNRQNQQRELWQLSGVGSEIRNNGITVQSVTGCSIEHVITARNRSGGVVTTLGVDHLTVRHLEAYDNEFDGLACYETTDSFFGDLHLHDNPGAGISLDLAFNHNVVSNANLIGNDLGIFMRASNENEFHNINIRDSHNFGVFMAHTELVSSGKIIPAPKSECTNNAFTNLLAKNCGNAAFRVNNESCTNNVVIRPRFDENHKGGLSLAAPGLLSVR